MTEAEWLSSSDPMEMFWDIHDSVSERKAALFTVACARSAPLAEVPELLESAIAVIERAAEGGDAGEVEKVSSVARDACGHAVREYGLDTAPHFLALTALRLTTQPFADCAAHVPLFLAKAVQELMGAAEAEQLARLHADLLRDVIGNPSRLPPPRRKRASRGRSRARPAPAPPWRTADVLGLARSIYEERRFEHLPILADALEDAGCDNAEVLEHCRAGGPHVRGCFVVDCLLARA
jgi:hypothetical protein